VKQQREGNLKLKAFVAYKGKYDVKILKAHLMICAVYCFCDEIMAHARRVIQVQIGFSNLAQW